jgi:ATP-binding cassette subfamily C exporter for protease/lipase
MVILTYITDRSVRQPLADSNNSAAETSQFVATNMRHGEVIEAMGMFPMMLERWQKKQERHLAHQAIASDRAGFVQGITKFVRMTNQSVAMGVGGFLFLSTDVAPSIVFAAMLLSSRISGPIESLLMTWSQLGTTNRILAPHRRCLALCGQGILGRHPASAQGRGRPRRASSAARPAPRARSSRAST